MSSAQKDLIIAYRDQGLSYRKIAEKTHTSEQFCRTVWSRANRERAQKQPDPEMNLCRYCGHLLVNLPGAKPKQFCSDKCRSDYHNHIKMHKAYIRTCEHCGNEFVAFGYPKKRFCSRDCQTATRERGTSHE